MLSKKAQEILKKLSQSEKANIRRMNPFGKSQFIAERFGNRSERFGVSFGLFPLWVKEAADELEK